MELKASTCRKRSKQTATLHAERELQSVVKPHVSKSPVFTDFPGLAAPEARGQLRCRRTAMQHRYYQKATCHTFEGMGGRSQVQPSAKPATQPRKLRIPRVVQALLLQAGACREVEARKVIGFSSYKCHLAQCACAMCLPPQSSRSLILTTLVAPPHPKTA